MVGEVVLFYENLGSNRMGRLIFGAVISISIALAIFAPYFQYADPILLVENNKTCIDFKNYNEKYCMDKIKIREAKGYVDNNSKTRVFEVKFLHNIENEKESVEKQKNSSVTEISVTNFLSGSLNPGKLAENLIINNRDENDFEKYQSTLKNIIENNEGQLVNVNDFVYNKGFRVDNYIFVQNMQVQSYLYIMKPNDYFKYIGQINYLGKTGLVYDFQYVSNDESKKEFIHKFFKIAQEFDDFLLNSRVKD